MVFSQAIDYSALIRRQGRIQASVVLTDGDHVPAGAIRRRPPPESKHLVRTYQGTRKRWQHAYSRRKQARVVAPPTGTAAVDGGGGVGRRSRKAIATCNLDTISIGLAIQKRYLGWHEDQPMRREASRRARLPMTLCTV